MSEKLSCPTCRKRLPNGPPLRFCPFCGQKLAMPEQKPVKSATKPSLADMAELDEGEIVPLPPSRSKSLDRKMVLLIGGSVLLLALVVTIAYVVVRFLPGDNAIAVAPPVAPPAPQVALPALPPLPESIDAPPPVPTAPVAPAKPVEVRRPAYANLTPAPPTPDENAFVLTEQSIDKSIRRGVDFLLSQYDGSKIRPEAADGSYLEGVEALSALALVYVAKTNDDDARLTLKGTFMRGVLDHVKTLPMEGRHSNYTRGLRLSVLSLANRPQDRPAMLADLQYLMRSHYKGGFTYGMRPDVVTPGSFTADNSNSQYGVLGVWAAAEAGLGVSPAFWADVETYWLDRQNANGGWGYTSKTEPASTAMTAAGLTSLALVMQQQSASPSVARDKAVRRPVVDAVARAAEWLGKDNNLQAAFGNDFPGYAVYGVERAGLASGYRFMGNKDWFLTLAPMVIERQQKDGSWLGGTKPVGETAFHLLFLSRGSFPILMTKLEFDGNWNTRPTDVAALTRYAGFNLERNFNWQIVPISQPWQNWTGSPVVFMASDAAPNVDDTGLEQIRQFVEHGNLLFTHVDRGSEAFNAWVEATAAKLFPDYPMRDVPEDHPIYTVAAIIKKKQPLRMVSNGSRVLWLHSPTDVTERWQKRFERSDPDAFGLGVNVAVYATGLSPFRSRLQSIVEQGEDLPRDRSFPVVRIKHAANWRTEPAAWGNFGRWLGKEAGIGVYTIDAEATNLDPFEQPVAHLTGTTNYSPSKEEISALTRYVTAGGTLLVDPTGGSTDFADSVKLVIGDLIAGGAGIEALAPDSTLVALPKPWPAMPTAETRVAVGRGDDDTAVVPKVYRLGQGAIVLFDRDLTTGLLGANVWNLHGFTPAWSRAMARNLIVATIERAKRAYPATASATTATR